MSLGFDRQALLTICEKFINSGEDVTLAHLVDAVNTAIPDHTSQDWKDWAKHMDDLNQAWVAIHKEGIEMAWPTPPAGPSNSGPSLVTPTADPKCTPFLAGRLDKDERDRIRAQRKLEHDGKIDGIGPNRQHTSLEQGRKKAGRQRDALVDELVIDSKEQKPNEPGKTRTVTYCIACDSYAPHRDANRVKIHAKNCSALPKMFPKLYARLMEHLAKEAHSTKLGDKADSTTSKASTTSTASANTQSIIHTYMNPAKITEHQRLNIELLMFKMFICCALPWALIDSEFFVSFVFALAPNFTVPDRSSFFPKHLAREVAAWKIQFQSFLEAKNHLTLSLDGWSTRAKDEVYTFHTTTPKRRSFFTDGHIFNGISVTAQALKEVIEILLVSYDAKKYSAIAGDGAANVRAAKILINSIYPWILNIYDPCHNLNLYMKDLGKIFKETLAIVSAIANYFGKSNYGTHQLDVQRKIEGVREGIKSASDTRFSSSYSQVLSVHDCMSPIKKCVQSKTLKFDTAATKKLLPYIQDGRQHYTFMSSMSGFIQLLSSGANAIITLEGQNTTCADVFYAWVCIAHHLEEIMASPAVGVDYLRGQVVSIYNHRFGQMMEESSHHLFLLAYFLHPLFRNHGGLQLTMPVLVGGVQALQKEQYPALFKTLLTSVLQIFQGEQKRNQDSGSEVVPELIRQFTVYAYDKEPFHSALWSRETKPLKWWTELLKDSNSYLLAQVAVKLFSISPSEICDERTASRLGWFNAARRSSITPEHLVDSAKLYDFYVNGFSEGKSTHTARVHLSKVTASGSTSSPSVRSAPSIMDLLNEENIEPTFPADVATLENLWFNNPDPYDLAETDRVDPYLNQEPFVVRTSTRFAIADYVKLDDAKLTALIANVDTQGPGVDVTGNGVAPQAKPLGVPGEWDINSYL